MAPSIAGLNLPGLRLAAAPLRLRQPQLLRRAAGQTAPTRSTGDYENCVLPAPGAYQKLGYEYADHADTNGDGLCDGCSKELTVYVDVTLDACGGVLAEDEVTVIFGDAYGELPEPTREGYVFDGWYTEKDGGELVEAGTEVSDKAAHTLYAHWTQIKVFSVTVPAGFPLAVAENGEVTASTDAAISNNSTCEVRVTGVTLRTENGWTLVPFTYNMAAAKVDSKLIGFAIGGAQSVNGGDSESLALTGDWNIDAGGTTTGL